MNDSAPCQVSDGSRIPSCHMIVWSRVPHLSQIFCGFRLLEQRGAIRLSQDVRRIDYARPNAPLHLQRARGQHMLVVVDDRVRLHFDTHDSYEIDLEAAADADFYFKRSYWAPAIPTTTRAKILPLGLNYAVSASGCDILEIRRMLKLREPSIRAARDLAAYLLRLAGLEAPGLPMVVEQMCAPPVPETEPRVLFMVRAWDPREVAGDSAEKAAECVAMNEMRAECIAQLQARLGRRFHGGFQHSPYAARHYPRLLLPDNRLSARRAYLRLLRDFPICVATGGLHGSIGWKLAEYVAFSKAIVSEQLRYELPGNFEVSSNYLEFATPAQCVESTLTLIEDRNLRCRLMNRNWEYFNGYVRPDAVVYRALQIAAGLCATPARD